MRGDQPVRAAAAPTVTVPISTGCTLPEACEGCAGPRESDPAAAAGPLTGAREPLPERYATACHERVTPLPRMYDFCQASRSSGAAARRAERRAPALRAAGAAVVVLEADDVLQVRRGDLEDRRVVDRGDAVHRPGGVVEGGAGADDLLLQHRIADLAQLDPRAAALDEPRLVFLAVELQRQRVAGAHEQNLAAVRVGDRPDQLVAPRLLHAPRLEGPPLERVEVRRLHLGRSSHGRAAAVSRHAASHSGCCSTCVFATRSSLGVLTGSHRPSCRYARRRRSWTCSGNVVVSWSTRSGKRRRASGEST